jgi:hypothetical protein
VDAGRRHPLSLEKIRFSALPQGSFEFELPDAAPRKNVCNT